MRRALVLAALTLAGCSGEPALVGADEPIRVRNGTFKTGDLPGSPPIDGGSPEKPNVTTVDSVNNVLRPGQSGKTLSGHVTDDASAVAVRFSDLGTGYWVVVADAPDPAAPGELTWQMTFDVAYDAAPGLHTLRFAGVNEAGAAGTQTDLLVCVASEIPDNLNACDPTLTPPAAVLSLAWDTDVDLDLTVVTPSGQVVDAKHPTTAAIGDGGVTFDPKKDGLIDRDSDANCVPDHVKRESLVWQASPAAGTWLAYANLYAACGQQAVRFTITLSVAQPTGDGGTSHLVEVQRASGELLATDQNAGQALGLYVTSFSFP